MRGRPLPRLVAAVALAGAVVLGGTVVLGSAVPAQAHNFLVGSTPTAGELVTSLPESFSVTTNQPLLDLSGTGAGFAIQVTDAAGAFYGDGCLTVLGATLSMPASLGAAGTYRVVWQVISEDGHTVSDEYTFEWSPSPGFEPATGSAAPPVCGADVPEETSTPTAQPTPPAATEATESPMAPPERTNANLADVLWIGGAVLAVIVAGAVTLLVVARRNRATAGSTGETPPIE
jgi:methionine-rich copper-binding protein CopC